ncbi:LrgB family protein [Paraburkholderia guartelaensis]|uniref:LrgB family protein n=1 Tax=Paraburkholderia guartelaensis TaxID=2546446 RepID=A0A4R5LJZ2_9BURK|nr:LrgB family protein [Paraburkholderia guartelaensis]TDG09999.1 LrgB family protein [Paraburkholderia guartelaensis]
MPDHAVPAFIGAWLTSSDVPAIAATIGVYLLACWIHQRCGRNPLANPVAIAVLLLTGLLKLAGIPYQAYFEHARFIHFLLGPAIVALAVPLHRQLHKLRNAFVPLVFGLLAGSCVAVVSAVAIAVMFGCQPATVASLAPKSVTAAIGMLISAKVGGMPALTAAIVIATGITGAVMGTFILGVLGIQRDDARGFAIGVASHGIGTARAFQISEEAGAFAGLGMAMNGTISALVLPFVLPMVIAHVSG